MGNIKITGGQVLQNDLPVGLGGTNYVYVGGSGTPSENATELQAAYNKAKTMSPSSGNTITVVVAPGTYTFGATAFTVDTPYIDVVSLTGNADVVLSSIEVEEEITEHHIGVCISSDNVFLKGVNTKELLFYISGDNYSNIKCENCIGGAGSFGTGRVIVSGTFIDCTGGYSSFGGGGTASGTFINCIGGDYSFGGIGTASGTFIDCTGGNSSFGGAYGTASGIFTDCTGGNSSFGGAGTASGTFTDCTGGDGSFGGGGGTVSSTARLNNCTGGNASFGGGGGDAFGTFINCTGGLGSFGGGGGTISSTARLYYCRLTSGTFETPQAGGKLVLCIDGTDSVVTTA